MIWPLHLNLKCAILISWIKVLVPSLFSIFIKQQGYYSTYYILWGHTSQGSYRCGLVYHLEVQCLSVLGSCVCSTLSLKISNSFCIRGTMMKAKSNLPKNLNIMFESSDEAILPYANTVNYVKKNVRFLPIIKNWVKRFKKVPKTTLLRSKSLDIPIWVIVWVIMTLIF